jgi:hypothetical protein
VSPFRRRREDLRQLLLQDAIRVAGYLEAILATARAMNTPDTLDLATGLLFVRMWLRKVEVWIETEDQP